MSEITKPLVLDSTMQSGFHSLNAHLETIAIMMGKNFSGSWIDVQNIVMQGKGAVAFPIGTQFNVEHSVYGNLKFDVVAHNYDKNANGDSVPSMTLLMHDFIPSVQFDEQEAMYYAEEELPAGTYNFKYGSTFYNFTTTAPIPVGGQLLFTWRLWDGADILTGKIVGYASQTSKSELFRVSISAGESGESLGTIGAGNLNHIHRTSYGSNNWGQSAMRQFLNSDANAGEVWTPQTKFDRPPSWSASLVGFMKGLPAEFLSVIGESKIGNKANSVYETEGYSVNTKYYTNDKFWLPSMTEVGFGTEGTNDGTVRYPFFDGATNDDRIKHAYNSTSAGSWFLRSPNPSVGSNVRYTTSSGSLYYLYAYHANGACPACVIY